MGLGVELGVELVIVVGADDVAGAEASPPELQEAASSSEIEAPTILFT